MAPSPCRPSVADTCGPTNLDEGGTVNHMMQYQATTVKPTRGELGAVIGICLAFVALNLLTATLYPPVNWDEILFTDPAVNLATGKGFRSSVWHTQPYDPIFASNAPLYPLLLAVWIQLTSFTPTAVRLLNYFFMAIAASLVWFGAAKSELIRSPRNRVFLLCVILFGEGVSLAFRMGRYDTLGILVLAMIWVVSLTRIRAFGLFLLGCLLALSGFQNLVFMALMAGLFWW